MLNAKTVQTISDAVKYGAHFQAILFEWDSAHSRLIVTRSWKQRTFFVLIALYLSAEAIYQSCTLFSQFHARTISLQSYMMLIPHFFSRLCGLSMCLVNGYNAESIATFFNQMLQTNRRFKVYIRSQKAGDKCAKFLGFFNYFFYLQPLLPAFTYVQEYKDIRYWQGAVFPVFILPFIRPCFFVVEYWISFYGLSGPFFWGYITCSYCYASPDWMGVLRLKRRYVDVLEWQRSRVRNSSCILYKGLHIMNHTYNGFYANLTGGGLAACMVMLVLMLTFSIRLTPQIAFPGSLIFPIGALALLQIPRKALSYTVNVIEASMAFIGCYRHNRNPVQAKAARSVMPLVIHVSIFCEMSRGTMLEFYSHVINNTVSMLLIE